jgi:hypothetical protein
MKNQINILSVLMLIVYGAMTMVIVPLHHHTPEDGTQQHAAAHASHDCGVCTYASASVSFAPSADEVPLAALTNESIPVEAASSVVSVFVDDSPRRGPPSLLS